MKILKKKYAFLLKIFLYLVKYIMNIKIFKNETKNINKKIFFLMTPTYATFCPKKIISHFITGNKLYEIMKNHLPKIKWNKFTQSIRSYSVILVNPSPKCFRRIIQYIPKKTNIPLIKERNGIEIFNPYLNFKYGMFRIYGLNPHNINNNNMYVNSKYYVANGYKNVKELKKSCKNNRIKGYSNLKRKELIFLLMKL